MSGLDEILQQQDDDEANVAPDTTETGKAVEKPVEKTDEKVDDKAAAPDAKADETLKPDDAAPAVPPENTELNDLRQFIREQRKEIAAMKAKMSRVKETGDVDDEGNTTVTYTPLEQLQIELHNVAVKRTDTLTDMVEIMSLNPKFEDVYDICTKANFDDIFEMAAATISRTEQRDFNEVLVQLELEVWKKPNPYKYMYAIIKENHPKYKGKAAASETPTTPATKETPKTPETAKKVLEAKEAPGSIAALGAGDNSGTSAWTAAKIDDLDESELHQVPTDIYQKYMMGKLK